MSAPLRILLSGASGVIGSPLATALAQDGHDVIRLVRHAPTSASEFHWDPYAGAIDERALNGLDAVINLSGAGIGDGRWTPHRKRVLRDSRIATTGLLAQHLADLDDPPAVFISQSAIGIYGDRGDEILSEDSTVGPRDDFLAALAMDWEAAAEPARNAGIRVVHPRTGIVLDRSTQLIQRLIPLFKKGLGGPIGDGNQWWSWITLRDVIRATGYLLKTELAGPVNLVAPVAIRQREFAATLAAAVHRPALLPVPRFGMRLALGAEKAASLGLTSTRAVPERLERSGFEFADADLASALAEMLT